MTGSFRVLVVESDADAAAELRSLLHGCAEGQEMLPVAASLVPDAETALGNYAELRPQLVIFGPCTAGTAVSEDLQRLRARAGVEPVPILFVKSAQETLDVTCLHTGCDDILLQPYNTALVRLKLAGLQRFSEFSGSLLAQRNRIRRHRADLLQEQASARQIFSNMGHESCLDQNDAIRYHLSPRAVLNGDVLAAAYAPGGKLMLLLGDFTGHGLPAAVGAVPLTSIFYSMVPKGFSLSHILRELNAKLHRILPTNMFCCALMLELDPHKQQARMFNAGMPSACLRHANGKLRLLESRHLPLGVLAAASVEEAIVHFPVEAGDHLYLWSDGIHEARSADGELFGERRLLDVVEAPPGQCFESILAAVKRFSGDQEDDLSLVEIALDRARSPSPQPVSNGRGAALGEWSINFTLGPNELRHADPLPLLHSVLAQVPGADRFQDPLTIVLGELFRNALEHGLLRLDSGLKKTDRGFADYYQQLQSGRRALTEGWIRIDLRCRTRGGRGALEVVVEDSGSGLPEDTGAANAYSGRGLPLLRAICREVRYQPGSSCVRAVLDWGAETGRRQPVPAT
ncbi:fused response regulator/phosphatase [Microbulbifer sp. SAOS-129_SWC]|uniref:ATP-binding SpoIIE family protein phosphatase n=1 Tax=Microbulbifer sp. SAOS-129_SWC TaxID=3145235 RepID=UPI00321666CF